MTRFESGDRSTMVVPAPREDIWRALTDPDLLADLTPLLDRVDAHGQRWTWHMSGISALGVEVAPSFTETMEFTEGERIDFSHTPPQGSRERSGADGVYLLADADDGTELEVDITIHVDLPLPAISRNAVQRIMRQTMQRTGDRFHDNLLAHLGVPAHR